MRTIKGFESGKILMKFSKRMLLWIVKILTPCGKDLCGKSIKRKCVHIINLKLIQIAFVIMECFGNKNRCKEWDLKRTNSMWEKGKSVEKLFSFLYVLSVPI